MSDIQRHRLWFLVCQRVAGRRLRSWGQYILKLRGPDGIMEGPVGGIADF